MYVCMYVYLLRLHDAYLQRVLHRCFLTPGSAKVAALFPPVLTQVRLFCHRLLNLTLADEGRGVSFSDMAACKTIYQKFQMFTSFLYKVINKLANKGFEELKALQTRLSCCLPGGGLDLDPNNPNNPNKSQYPNRRNRGNRPAGGGGGGVSSTHNRAYQPLGPLSHISDPTTTGSSAYLKRKILPNRRVMVGTDKAGTALEELDQSVHLNNSRYNPNNANNPAGEGNITLSVLDVTVAPQTQGHPHVSRPARPVSLNLSTPSPSLHTGSDRSLGSVDANLTLEHSQVVSQGRARDMNDMSVASTISSLSEHGGYSNNPNKPQSAGETRLRALQQRLKRNADRYAQLNSTVTGTTGTAVDRTVTAVNMTDVTTTAQHQDISTRDVAGQDENVDEDESFEYV